VDVAGDTLLIERQVVEGLAFEGEDFGLSDGVVDTMVFAFEFAVLGGFAVGEGILFDGFEAVEVEIVDGEGSGKLNFGGADGLEAFDIGPLNSVQAS
jgi:hypothetical protein